MGGGGKRKNEKWGEEKKGGKEGRRRGRETDFYPLSGHILNQMPQKVKRETNIKGEDFEKPSIFDLAFMQLFIKKPQSAKC